MKKSLILNAVAALSVLVAVPALAAERPNEPSQQRRVVVHPHASGIQEGEHPAVRLTRPGDLRAGPRVQLRSKVGDRAVVARPMAGTHHLAPDVAAHQIIDAAHGNVVEQRELRELAANQEGQTFAHDAQLLGPEAELAGSPSADRTSQLREVEGHMRRHPVVGRLFTDAHAMRLSGPQLASELRIARAGDQNVVADMARQMGLHPDIPETFVENPFAAMGRPAVIAHQELAKNGLRPQAALALQ